MKFVLHKKEIAWLGLFMGVHLALKLVLLVWGGPMRFTDTEEYLRYAQQIVASTEWLGPLNLHQEFLPVSIWRMPGYPLVVAAFQWISPESWGMLLVLVQSFFSVLTGGLLLVFLLRCGVRPWLALAAVVWQALSVRPLMDLSLLTDSLYSNLLVVVLLGLSWPGAAENKSLFKPALGGVLYALALLLRETAWVFLPLVAAGHFVQGVNPASLKKTIVFLLAPLLLVTGLRAWNRYRTGTAFLTVGPATALMQPIMLVGDQPFGQNTPLDTTARRYIKNRTYREVLVALRELHRQHGLTAIEINGMVSRKFKRSLVRHPRHFARYSAVNLAYASGLMLNLWQGIRHVQVNVQMSQGQSVMTISREHLVLWLAARLSFILSMVLVGVFFVGGLIVGAAGFVGRGLLPPPLARVVLWWVMLLGGMLFAHSLINIEARYLGFAPSLIVSGVVLGMAALWPGRFSTNPAQATFPVSGNPVDDSPCS